MALCPQAPSPLAPLEHLDIPVYCSHFNPAVTCTLVDKNKTFRPQPQESVGGGASRAGPGHTRLLPRSHPALWRSQNNKELVPGWLSRCARVRGGPITGRRGAGCEVGTSLPIRARGIGHPKNSLPRSPRPRSKVLGLVEGENSRDERRPL